MLEIVQVQLRAAEDAFARRAGRRQVEERLQGLTPREREVLQLVVAGLPSRTIARRLGTSVKNIDVHRARSRPRPRPRTWEPWYGTFCSTGSTSDQPYGQPEPSPAGPGAQ